MKVRKIVMFEGTKEKILKNPSLGCTSTSSLSQILNFKRNNARALKVRNYAMNCAQSLYVEYYDEKNSTDSRTKV